MAATLGLVLDCADPAKLAEFWSAAIGYTTLGAAGNYVLLVDPDGHWPKLLLQRVDEPKSARILETEAGRTLAFRMQDETVIEIELERPTIVRLPGHPPKGGDQEITAVRIWVDNPKAFMDEVRKHL